MIYSIHYGKEIVDLNIEYDVEVLRPHQFELEDEESLIKKALDNPYHMVKFEEFAAFEESLLVVVNEHRTRRTFHLVAVKGEASGRVDSATQQN